jgi:hypothetical protein
VDSSTPSKCSADILCRQPVRRSTLRLSTFANTPKLSNRFARRSYKRSVSTVGQRRSFIGCILWTASSRRASDTLEASVCLANASPNTLRS